MTHPVDTSPTARWMLDRLIADRRRYTPREALAFRLSSGEPVSWGAIYDYADAGTLADPAILEWMELLLATAARMLSVSARTHHEFGAACVVDIDDPLCSSCHLPADPFGLCKDCRAIVCETCLERDAERCLACRELSYKVGAALATSPKE